MEETALWIALSVGAMLGSALVFYPLLRFGTWVRAAVLAVLSLVLFGLPLQMAEERTLLRLVVAVLAIGVLMGLYDVHRTLVGRRGPGGELLGPADLRSYLAFLSEGAASGTFRRWGKGPRLSLRRNLRDLIVGIAMLAAAAWTLGRVDWRGLPVAAEYVFKVVLVFVGVDGLGLVATALLRLAGRRPHGFHRSMWLAPTPAEFWRRYNMPVNRFFHEHVFRPMGGWRRPLLSVMAVFAASGVAHELLFFVALGRVQGYQTIFFLLQGPAVAATLRLRPRGAWRFAGIAATYVWLLGTAVLFFLSGNQVIRIFVER